MRTTEDGLVVNGVNGSATGTPEPTAAKITTEQLSEAIQGRDVWRARIDPSEAPTKEGSDVRPALTVDLKPK